MEFIISIICIIVMALVILQLYEKIGITKLITLALTGFFSLYVIISAFYLLANSFNILIILSTTLVLELGVLLIYYLRDKKIRYDNFYWDRETLLPLLIILFVFPLTFQKFEFFGMGQDQGVYQTKVLSLLSGNTDVQQDFEEFSTLNDEEKKTFIESTKSGLLGFDNYDSKFPPLDEDDELSKVSGIYHGIPTFPALLALWSSFFGFENMMNIQTLFYCLSIMFIFLICDNLSLSKRWTAFSIIIFAISPETIWVSKSALTEMFLTVILTSYLYFITEKEKKFRWISALSIVTFSFYHVTIYTLMPMFILMYFILYVYDCDNQYLKAIVISSMGYAIGFIVISNLSPQYIYNNYKQLYDITHDIIKIDNLLFVIISAVTLVVIVGIAFNYNKIQNVVLEFIDRCKNLEKISAFTIRMLLVLSLIFITVLIFNADSYEYFKLVTLNAYMYVTGVIILPLIYILLFKDVKKLLKDRNAMIFTLTFMYVVVIYSCIFKPETKFYYYYARYLVPFIPVVVIFASILLNNLKAGYTIVCTAIILAIYAPYDYYLASVNDDSKVEWNVLSDLASQIDSEDMLIIDDTLMTRFYLPLRDMTGATVYLESNFDYIKDNLLDDFTGDVYLLTDRINTSYIEPYEIIYKNLYTASENVDSKPVEGIIPFPKEFDITEQNIELLKYNVNMKKYDFEDPKFKSVGFSAFDGTGVWTLQELSSVVCYLEKQPYILNIDLGNLIPFAMMDDKEFKVDVFLNYDKVDEFVINEAINGQNINLPINSEYVQDGENILTFKSDLWKNSEFEFYGFSIRSIEFIKSDIITEYNFGEDDNRFAFKGFANNEGTFRWVNSEYAVINTRIDNRKNYNVKIYLKSDMTLDVFNDENIGYVTFNGKKEFKKNILKSSFVKEADDFYYEFNISSSELLDSEFNNLEINTTMWSPSKVYGTADTRSLGLAIDKVVFTEVN